MQFVDQIGRQVSIGAELGRGGEGTVFEVVGQPELVAKLYKESIGAEKVEKLVSMTTLASPELQRLAAWPQSVLFSGKDRVPWGITMPRLRNAKEIHVLYSPAQRRVHFQHADWRFLVRTARNCAAAFATLHERGIVMGDVNHGNVFVDQQAIVRLIDCDSFQLAARGRVYRCLVGVSDFTPPELQFQRFDSCDRTENHDCFGLAVLIFQLLFMGRHPFVGRFLGRGEMPTLEESISQYRFAFGRDAGSFSLAPPPHSPTLQIVPTQLGMLFERAFGNGSQNPSARPRACEWAASLDQVERSIQKCGTDPGHVFSAAATTCPWCMLTANGGPNFFISVTVLRIQAAPRIDVEGIWVRISSISRPGSGLARAPRRSPDEITPVPPPEYAADRELLTSALGITALASFGVALVLVWLGQLVLALTVCVVAIAIAGSWGILRNKSPLQHIRSERRRAFRVAHSEHSRVVAAVKERLNAFTGEFDEKLRELDRLRQELAALDQERGIELGRMQKQAKEQQFTDYMERFNIADAGIPGIGEHRAEELAYQGIETAWDIPDYETIVLFPGFGDALANRLIFWKEGLARQFQFNAAQGLPANAIQMLNVKYQQRRVQLEMAIQSGEPQLRRLWLDSKNELESLDRRAAMLEDQLEQARADLQVVGSAWDEFISRF